MFLPSFHRFFHGSWAESRTANQRIYPNDKTQLAAVLDRDVSHRSALEAGHALESAVQVRTPTQRVQIDRSFGLGR